MGTNFYLITPHKSVCKEYFGMNYELTDIPEWGYQIHIAKTSAGWLPLFQAHGCFRSIRALKALYETGDFIIANEYGDTYSWEQFDKRVLQHNGGVRGAKPRKEVKRDPSSPCYDYRMPNHTPVSHFDYKYDYSWGVRYFADVDGYEFTDSEFS